MRLEKGRGVMRRLSTLRKGFVHVTRLGRAFVAGLLLWGLPLAWLALTTSAAIAYTALVLVGIGNAIEDVGLFTLVARSASPAARGECWARPSSWLRPGRAPDLWPRLCCCTPSAFAERWPC